MKKFSLLLLFVASLHAQVLLTDDFDSPNLDRGKWTITLPFSSSSVTANNGGGLTTMGRGIVASVAGIRVPHAIAGTFTPLHGYEHFIIMLRTDLSPVIGNQYGGKTGLMVAFICDGSAISIQRWPANGDWRELARKDYRLPGGRAYSFTITDTGSRITVAVNGIERLSADTDFRTGDRIAFHSREFAYTGTRIEGVTVTAIPPPPTPTVITVPDNSGRLVNLSTLGSGGFTMGFVVAGSTPKTMLIRAVGPSLARLGVSNTASQTSLTVYSGSSIIGANSNWSAAPNVAQMTAFGGAFPLVAGSADSAVLMSLSPGNYTAQAAANGAVLLEVYEVP